MITQHHEFLVLIKHFYFFCDQSVFRFLVVILFFDGHGCFQCITDEYGPYKTQAFVTIGHGHLIDPFSGEADANGKYECTMCDPLFEGLCLAPLFIHMMREKIAGLPGMQHNISFSDRSAFGSTGTVEFKFFEILFDKHGSQ